MSNVIVFMNLTLDGVIQAPGRPDEDSRGGFQYGGWAMPYATMESADDRGNNTSLLLGRRTYEDFFSVWPNRTDNPYTDVLNNTQKYVASTTLSEPLPWRNSTLLQGDAVAAVARLKEEKSNDLVILGSGTLVRSLMPHKLVDVYVLHFHPLILGDGRRLFSDDGTHAALRLVGTKTTSTGVVIATYNQA